MDPVSPPSPRRLSPLTSILQSRTLWPRMWWVSLKRIAEGWEPWTNHFICGGVGALASLACRGYGGGWKSRRIRRVFTSHLNCEIQCHKNWQIFMKTRETPKQKTLWELQNYKRIYTQTRNIFYIFISLKSMVPNRGRERSCAWWWIRDRRVWADVNILAGFLWETQYGVPFTQNFIPIGTKRTFSGRFEEKIKLKPKDSSGLWFPLNSNAATLLGDTHLWKFCFNSKKS